MKYNITIFSDFDGTITKKDIGDEVFREFGKFEPYHSMLRSGELEISQYWRVLCDNLKPGVTLQDFHDFALSAEIDTNFKPFAEFCRKKSWPLRVVSDGFDAYIKPIMNSLGLNNIEVYSNRLEAIDGRLSPSFPGASESCLCPSASCKRNSILKNWIEDTIIVYIGDGYSDFCAAEHADIIFAKKELAAYCNKNRLPHYPYQNFFDVRMLLEKAVNDRKVRIRHQANIKRKSAFETE